MKVAIYIRVSTQFQVDKDSLHVQRRELISYSDIILGIHDYTVFEDAGYSAKNTDRPQYQQMLERTRKGEFSHILVWKIDRISRNLLDFASMYSELKDLGVTFVSKNEQFDTSTAVGEAMLKIILVFAELERQMTSERVTAVMLSRANNGQWNGGKIPFGYNYDKTTQTFTVNPKESPIIESIYHLYLQSSSIIYVCKSLNAQGIPTRNSNKWAAPTLHRILTNPFYYGAMRYNTYNEKSGYKKNPLEDVIVIEDHHPPIISKDTFTAVQHVLHNNRKTSEKTDYTRKNIHILAGLLYCDLCNAKMYSTIDRIRNSGYKPTAHICPNRREKNCNCPITSDINIAPTLFSIISALLIASRTEFSDYHSYESFILSSTDIPYMENLEQFYELSKSGHTLLEYAPEFSPDLSPISNLQTQQTRLRNALTRLNSLYLYSESPMPESEYTEQRRKIESELATLETQISSEELPNSITEKATYFLFVQQLIDHKFINYERFMLTADKLVIKSFLNQILSRIGTKNNRLSSLTFKNGITLKIKQSHP